MLKRSDVVQIPFPFSDLTQQKRRPVMLLTSPDAFGDFLAVAITSQAGHDDAIQLQDDDIANGRLPKISWFEQKRELAFRLGGLIPTCLSRLNSG